MWQHFRSLKRLMCPDEERCAISTALDPEQYLSHYMSLNDAVFQMQVRFRLICSWSWLHSG